jgi:uncharacterized protein (DUF983 family)
MKLLVSFARAVTMRCPNCGAAGLRSGWISTVACCPACRLRLDRGEADYFLGAYTINLLGALALAVGLAVLAVARPTWPRALIYGAGIAAIMLFAFWFYPFSRLLWLAFDLAFRGTRPTDFDRA